MIDWAIAVRDTVNEHLGAHELALLEFHAKTNEGVYHHDFVEEDPAPEGWYSYQRARAYAEWLTERLRTLPGGSSK